jgi:hypothetical protein
MLAQIVEVLIDGQVTVAPRINEPIPAGDGAKAGRPRGRWKDAEATSARGAADHLIRSNRDFWYVGVVRNS